MEYLNYIYETIEDIYYYNNNKYQTPLLFSLNSNLIDENENEINKVIKDAEKEIKMDKEIKELENRYNNLCEFMKEEYNDNENQNNNNEGALKIRVKNFS